jgi:hypothetical protein
MERNVLHVILSQVIISNPLKSQHEEQQNSKFSCAFSLLLGSGWRKVGSKTEHNDTWTNGCLRELYTCWPSIPTGMQAQLPT